ncbi:g10858 [Coccomyxa elongata]
MCGCSRTRADRDVGRVDGGLGAAVGAPDAHGRQVRRRKVRGRVGRGRERALRPRLARLELGVHAAHPRLLPLGPRAALLLLLALGKEVFL